MLFQELYFRQISAGVVLTALFVIPPNAVAQEPCQLAADYDALANKAEDAYEDDRALTYRTRAADLCASHPRWQALGDLAMKFGDSVVDIDCATLADSEAADCASGHTMAASSYISALALAESPAQQAESIGRYAQVLYLEQDPQKANNYISRALELDPESAWIRDLAEEIPRSMNSREALRSGLGDFTVPEMVLASLDQPSQLPTNMASNADSSGAAAPVADSAATRTRSINLPINFLLNSARLDEASRDRLTDLVAILAEEPDRSYHLIGHADVTGSADRNQILSEERAETLYEMIVLLEPGLENRITYEGVGSSRPMRWEMTPEAHSANRRVEVFVK